MTALLLSALVLVPTLPELDFADVEHKVIAARKQISRGHVIVRVMGTGPSDSKATMTVYFEGDKWRADTQQPYEKRPPGAIHPSYTVTSCYGCFPGESHVFYSTMVVPEYPGKEWALSLEDADAVREKYPTFDVRVLGLDSGGASEMWRTNLDSPFSRPMDRQRTIAKGKLGDLDVYKLELLTQNGTNFCYWVDPSKDFGVLRIEATHGKYRWVTTSTVKFRPESAIWFPDSVLDETFREDKLVKTERLEIEVITLNEPIDPKVFTLQGIEHLPAGAPVSWLLAAQAPPADGYLIWNGHEIVSGTPPVMPEVGTIKGRKAVFVFTFALCCAIAAAFCVWRYLKAKPQGAI